MQEKICSIALSLKDNVFDAYATRFRDLSPAKGVTAANRAARDLLGETFESAESALDRVSGKEVLRQLSGWIHQKYGRGVSLRDILKEMQSTEIQQEVKELIEAIENNRPFA